MNDIALPELPREDESARDKMRRRINALAEMLGEGFSFDGGLRYDNGQFNALLNNRGLRLRGPVAGGRLEGNASIVDGDPRLGLEYRRELFGGELEGSVDDIGGDPRYRLNFIKRF